MNNEEKILEVLSRIETDVAELKTDVAELKTDVAELKTDVADLKTRTTRLEMNQENIIMPALKALAEGQVAIQEQIKRISVIDRMEDDIATLKTAVRFLSEKVSELEKRAV